MNAAERGAGFFHSLAERLPLWVRCTVITHPGSELPRENRPRPPFLPHPQEAASRLGRLRAMPESSKQGAAGCPATQRPRSWRSFFFSSQRLLSLSSRYWGEWLVVLALHSSPVTWWCYPCFLKERPKAQRSYVTCPRSVASRSDSKAQAFPRSPIRASSDSR